LQCAAEDSLKFEIFDKMTDFLLKKGDYEKTEDEIKAFKNEIEIDKKNSDLKLVYKKLLQTHLQQERYVEASKDIFQLVEYPISEEKEQYIEILDKIIDKCPNDEYAWVSKGKILVNPGDAKEALKCFDNAIKLNPKEPEYYYAKAKALNKLRCHEKSLPLIEKAIELDGNNLEYWIERGASQGNVGKYEDAYQSFKKASEFKPEYPGFYYMQAFFLRFVSRKLNRLEEALKLIEKAIELDGNNDIYWEEKGRIVGDLGKYGDALLALQKASELNPKEPEYYRLQSLVLHDLNRFREALPLIEKAIELDGKNLSFWEEKAKILVKLGKHEEVMKCFRESIELNPENIDRILILLGFLFFYKKNLEEYQFIELTQFIYHIMEACLSKEDTQRANGLFLTLLKLNNWHSIDEVQNSIALYLRQLVDIKNRELFVNAVNSAREHITDQNLLELLKAFLYAGRYLQEGNKVILEEVFPEIREIILDMIEKFS
jgi:tetratricopeptide (TPR) repeat protein